jgi:hypothetical protein
MTDRTSKCPSYEAGIVVSAPRLTVRVMASEASNRPGGRRNAFCEEEPRDAIAEYPCIEV